MYRFGQDDELFAQDEGRRCLQTDRMARRAANWTLQCLGSLIGAPAMQLELVR